MTTRSLVITLAVVVVLGVAVFFGIRELSSAVNYQTCVNAMMGDDNMSQEEILTKCKK